MRVLVVEDEERLNRIICETLEDEGYEVCSCTDGRLAIESAARYHCSGVIIDLMLHGLNGIETARKLRQSGINGSVLFLTALDSITGSSQEQGAGADYYLAKPFDLNELCAVVREMTSAVSQPSVLLSFADLQMDIDKKTVTRSGIPISLTVKEYDMLKYMLTNSGTVLSRNMLEDALWKGGLAHGTNIVDVYIGYLRRKLDKGFEKKLIRTVRNVGWILNEH